MPKSWNELEQGDVIQFRLSGIKGEPNRDVYGIVDTISASSGVYAWYRDYDLRYRTSILPHDLIQVLGNVWAYVDQFAAK